VLGTVNYFTGATPYRRRKSLSSYQQGDFKTFDHFSIVSMPPKKKHGLKGKTKQNVNPKLTFQQRAKKNRKRQHPKPRKIVSGGVGKSKLYKAPLASGMGYSGSTMVLSPTRKNCMRLSTRAYIGYLVIKATTGATYFAPNGTDDTGGQFFFNPSNVFYMSTTSNTTFVSKMFIKYKINSIKFVFESQMTPGSNSPYRIFWAFIQDPALGNTYVGSYSTTMNIQKGTILANPISKSFPAWVPEHSIAPPSTWFKKLYNVRCNEINQPMNVSNTANVDMARTAYAFGLWMGIAGAIPTSDLIVSDVYIEYDIDLCQMAPYASFDATGGTTLSTSVGASQSPNYDLFSSSASSSDCGLDEKEKTRVIRKLFPYLDEKHQNELSRPVLRRTDNDYVKVTSDDEYESTGMVTTLGRKGPPSVKSLSNK